MSDISGPKSELIERTMTCLATRFHILCRRESKFAKQAATGVQDIFANLVIASLPEGQANDVYQQAARALNAYFHVQKNAVVLRQLHQKPGEDADSFVLRLRKQARHCGYGDEELEFAVRDQLLEKVSSQELRTKLFEVPKHTACSSFNYSQGNVIAGGEGKSSVIVVQHRESKETSGGQATHKCYACGRPGHFSRDLRGVRRVQSVVGRGTGQYVVGMRRIETRARVLGELSGSYSQRKSSVKYKCGYVLT